MPKKVDPEVKMAKQEAKEAAKIAKQEAKEAARKAKEEMKKAKQEMKDIKKTKDYKDRMKVIGNQTAATIWVNNKVCEVNAK